MKYHKTFPLPFKKDSEDPGGKERCVLQMRMIAIADVECFVSE